MFRNPVERGVQRVAPPIERTVQRIENRLPLEKAAKRAEKMVKKNFERMGLRRP
jgi:type II secretory pathway component PulJ